MTKVVFKEKNKSFIFLRQTSQNFSSFDFFFFCQNQDDKWKKAKDNWIRNKILECSKIRSCN